MHHNADLYGSSRMLLRCLKHLDRRRFEVLVVLPEDGPLKQWMEAEGIEVLLHRRLSVITRHAFGSWRIIPFLLNYPLSVGWLWRLLRRRRIEAVYTNTGVIISPALAAWLAGVPQVWRFQEVFHEFPRWWPCYAPFVQAFSRSILACSRAVAAQFKPPGRALVVHDGFPLDEFQVPRDSLREQFRSRYGLGDGFVVGCIGRIKFVRKGQEYLVRAVAILKRRGKRIKALIVGAPFPGNESHLQRLRELVAELQVQEEIVFTGEVPDARPAYAAVDVLALTSAQPEPFGGVVMEAMAMGLPVIATNIGGSLDQVVEGETGLLVPPADPSGLADAIEKLMDDSALRSRMGRNGLDRIRNQFGISHMTRKIEEILTASIERRAPDPSVIVATAAGWSTAAAFRRVLHVQSSSDVYGSGRSLLRLIQSMDRRRFQPLVILPEDGPLRRWIEAEGVEVILHPRLSVITRTVFNFWRLPLLLLTCPFSTGYLRRLIRRRRIDLVHTNTGVVFSSALAAWLAGIPHVWHVREWFREFPRLWFAYSPAIRYLSRTVVAVSNAIASQFSRRDKVVVVHNGFPLEEFPVPKEELRSDVRRQYGLNGAFVVGCVGRIKLVRKGQEILVQASALLKQRGHAIKALIVGAPFPGNEAHLTQLRELAARLGVEDRVVFTGEMSDTRPAYAAMDVLTLTSVQPEPFAGAVMEAMAMSLPVVATNVGGSPDQVVDGATGFLVPPGDPKALADAIEKLLLDPALRQRMSRAARERIQEHFSLKEMTRKIEEIFTEALTRR